MSFTDVIGRVSQIESAIAQVSGAHRGAAVASAATRSAAASGALAGSVSDSAGAGRSEFSDVMRSLTGSGSGAGSGGAGGLGGGLGSGGAAGSSGSSGSGGSVGSGGSGGSGGAAGAGGASGTSGSSRGTAAGASGSATNDAAAPTSQSRGSGTESRSGGVDGGDVLAQAKKYLGIPYVWGGTNPRVGLDCSGLVQLVFKDLGIKVPRVTYDQLKVGTEIPRLADAKPGDLIVTRNGDHIGIYAGDNKILHAPRPGKNVEIREMFEKDADILTIRRVVDAPGPSAARADGEVAAAQRSQFEASQRATSRSGGSS